MAGVAPAGSLDAGGEDIGREELSITLRIDGSMLILALDTSSAGGSVALVRHNEGEVTVVERAGDGTRTHAERLPAELVAVLDEAGAALRDVDRFAVAVGPGSFTGLRIGIATMQGLALTADRLVAPVTTFEALAWHAGMPGEAVAVWIEAHRGEVFATLLAPDGHTMAPPTARAPDLTLDAWREPLAGIDRVRFVGDGAVRYRALIADRLAERQDCVRIDTVAPALAGVIGRIAAADPGRAVGPHALVPLYVRRPDVELARERRQPPAS
jgi:tRNA threonylcarbamoyladenosine biosynthesis protein TsaB